MLGPSPIKLCNIIFNATRRTVVQNRTILSGKSKGCQILLNSPFRVVIYIDNDLLQYLPIIMQPRSYFISLTNFLQFDLRKVEASLYLMVPKWTPGGLPTKSLTRANEGVTVH